MTITDQEWNSLIYLKPSDFKNPDGLNFDVVSALDRFIGKIGSRPIILSDYRSGDPKTHGEGKAIDTTWPGVDPLVIYNEAMNFNFFHGVGIYINEQEIASFHFDTRDETLRINEPNRWGGIISHPYDMSQEKNVRVTEYVTAETVLDILKKKEVMPIIFLALFGLTIYLYINR